MLLILEANHYIYMLSVKYFNTTLFLDVDFHPGKSRLMESENNSQLVLMEKKLEIVKQMNKESSRLPIPLGNFIFIF